MAGCRTVRVRLYQLSFVLFCSSICRGEHGRLTTLPSNIHVLLNQRANVTYRTSMLKPTTVKFVKVTPHGDVTTIVDRPGARIFYEIKTEDGGKTLRATLHFNPVMTEDAGHYKCLIFQGQHMSASHSFSVKIIKRLPTPVVTTKDSSPPVGAAITLVCSLKYNLLSPTFLWAKNNEFVTLNARHKMVFDSLTIREVDPTDEGDYMCIVRQSDMYSAWSHNKAIKVKPVITIVPLALTMTKGEAANISCRVISGNTKNMKLLLVQDGRPSAQIDGVKNVSKAFHIRNVEETQTITYQCLLISNDHKNPVSKSQLARLTVVQSNFPKCPQQLASTVMWSSTAVGMNDVKRCPGDSTGHTTRRCLEGPAWSNPDFGKCTSAKFKHLLLQAEAIRLGGYTPSYNSSEILEILTNLTRTDERDELYGGDIDATVEILSNLVNSMQAKSSTIITTEEDQQRFLEICSNILDPVNTDHWLQYENQMENGTKALWNRLVVDVDRFGLHLTNQMPEDSVQKLIVKPNIVMKLDRISTKTEAKKKGLQFDYKEFESSLFLPPEVFSNYSADYKVVSLMYKTLNSVMRLSHHSTTQDNKESNATIVTSVVRPLPTGKFKEKVKIRLKNKMVHEPVPQRTCVFWREGMPNIWATDGCSLVTSESDKHVTTCECDHLTMFAAIMDPYGSPIPEEHRKPLELISTVGCAVSLIGILLTISVTMFFWKTLKAPRTVVLMNLCLAIGVLCVLVIAEGTARDTQVGCAFMAVFLHYFLLAVFCWMLCEGVFLYFNVTKIITVEIAEKTASLLFFGWGFPLLIVGISLAATRGKGYGYHGDSTACWLSVESGLIWACIAPAIVVLLINIAIYVLVIRRMMSTRYAKNKSRDAKLRMGIKASAVILPLLGITWLFGLLAFNASTVAFKYFFAIFNSLQGLMIFIFHCLLNHQVQSAFKGKFSYFSSAADSTGSTR